MHFTNIKGRHDYFCNTILKSSFTAGFMAGVSGF